MPPNSLRRTTETLEMIEPMEITLYSHFPIGLDEYTQQQPVPTRTNISSRGKCPIQSKGLPLVTYFIFSRRFSCLPSSSNHPHMKPPTCGCRGRLKRGRRSVSAKAGVRFLCWHSLGWCFFRSFIMFSLHELNVFFGGDWRRDLRSLLTTYFFAFSRKIY